MGSNPAPHAHAHAQQQAQAQAALQAQSQSQSQSQLQQQQQQQQQQHQQHQQQHQQHQQQPWYPGPDVLGLSSQQPGAGAPQAQSSSSFDPNFDFTQFDLGTGSDADLSALFIPDSMMWSFAEQPIQGFPGF
jgi:outer membrane protein OmpA-like peptidoglycan-associated protein